MVRKMRDNGITICYTAPTFYRQMAPYAKALGIPSLRICVSAGEALPDATRQLWKDATGIEMLDGIGGTEVFHIYISAAGADVRAGSIGKVVPGYQAKVVDENDHEVPRGTVGRLAVIGPTGCRYMDDARQTAYVSNGWNHPGDAFTQDEDGYFHYQARDDDMIITAGYNVGAPEVEDCLLTHPAVAECGVIGKSDEVRRHDHQGLRAARRPGQQRGHGRGAAGLRQEKHRALQVPARDRVRQRAAAHRDRQAAALQTETADMSIQHLQPPGGRPPRAMPTASPRAARKSSSAARSAGTPSSSSRPTTSSRRCTRRWPTSPPC
jgi:acyl-CoA synthetase (AMP-forming)/AMP-acid ligase II